AFGCKYQTAVSPRENLILLKRKLPNTRESMALLTGLFLEARYSNHQINQTQAEKARFSYLDILQEIRKNSSLWQKIILSLA
ncbi:DUF4129 domain-containing protein, partial [Candidatus Omnitrophota bacterium]